MNDPKAEAAYHPEPPPNLCPACSLGRHEICSGHISPCSCKDSTHG